VPRDLERRRPAREDVALMLLFLVPSLAQVLLDPFVDPGVVLPVRKWLLLPVQPWESVTVTV
jgi:hypothetical protein